MACMQTAQFIGTAGRPADAPVVSVDTAGSALPRVSLQVAAYSRTWTTKNATPGGWLDEVRQHRKRHPGRLPDGPDRRQRARKLVVHPGAGRRIPDCRLRQRRSGKPIPASLMFTLPRPGSYPGACRTKRRLDLSPTRRNTASGTLLTVVPAPFAGATGLVTIERGRILSSHVQSFPTNSTVIDVPITADMAPTVYLSGRCSRPSGRSGCASVSRLGRTKLTVSPARRRR